MTLRTRLALMSGFLLFMLCGLGIFSLVQMDRINTTSSELAQLWLPSTRYTMRLRAVCANFRIAEIQYISSTEEEQRLKYKK